MPDEPGKQWWPQHWRVPAAFGDLWILAPPNKLEPQVHDLMHEMEDFAGSPTALVADVDCTADGKDLCETHGVRGYPTIKYGDPSNLEDYEGGRDFDDLKKFAEENLKPSCGPANLDLCDDDKKKEIEGFLAMSDDDLNAAIAEKDKAVSDAEEHFKSEVEKLQSKYESLMEEKDKTIEEVKNSGLGLMKACKAHKANAGKEEL